MKRTAADIISAFFKPQFYIAFFNAFMAFDRPVDVLRRYVFAAGRYPYDVVVRTPVGRRNCRLYSFHDARTLIECFAKIDYPASNDISIIVDFGSNIGLSALYFLTRNEKSFVYLFEPVPMNIERLKPNLAGFEHRYALHDAAVGLEPGVARFGLEPTGRYGGLNINGMAEYIDVTVVEVNTVLSTIVSRHGSIDIIKIDVEGLERDLIKNLAPDVIENTRAIYAETFGLKYDLPGFSRRQQGAVTQYIRDF